MIKGSSNKRLRVFAGPNGSGKSTVIQYVQNYKVNGRSIDFGYYINADDIAKQLRTGTFDFTEFNIGTDSKGFLQIAMESGLINKDFPANKFRKSFTLHDNRLRLKDKSADERLAQIIADFLRKMLLLQGERFSFETVFSHSSKIDIMREAVNAGYKVYLYFVSTESPAINVFRVQARKAKGGHDVPADKIKSRYYRSLDLLYEASQLAYQAFFFDNSVDDEEFKMFAHFKIEQDKKKWDKIILKDVPEWFIKYYSGKIPASPNRAKKKK